MHTLEAEDAWEVGFCLEHLTQEGKPYQGPGRTRPEHRCLVFLSLGAGGQGKGGLSLQDLSLHLKIMPGTSLVVQGLRICTPMRGTWVRPLVQEDPTFQQQSD